MSIELQRDVAADPASVALLLAGPGAAAAWPGVKSIQSVGEPMQVCAEVPGRGPLRAVVFTQAPVRTPTAFVFGFTVSATGLPGFRGRLLIGHSFDTGGVSGSRLQLSLDYEGDSPERLHDLAEGFLKNLCEIAEGRSRAA